ncbi:Ig-like domain-containing protein [Tropicimonas isoalkanivorans]|uniref:Ig-like domain (Group 3) n=1 Tax=Tropicimonas isoalkanivorans TaxID=441112 RepID=A0A1I1N0X7_9RHOB|nr:Ig-like domain-containing protein [Tropicimonas isoalkanivorans]SFC87470.1 Ig-like domain (group 3) [Tropicimonas isoalkanivorans]
MPKPSGGNGSGGGKNGGSSPVFEVLGLTATEDGLYGTGQNGALVTVTVTDPATGQTWTGQTSTWYEENGVWYWVIDSNSLTNPDDSSDFFSDEAGDFTVVASYEEINQRNGRTKTISTEIYDLSIAGEDTTAPTASAPVLLASTDSGVEGDGVTNVDLASFRIDLDPTVEVGDQIDLLINGTANVSSTITQDDIDQGFIILTSTNSGLDEGTNDVQARLSDAAGNSSVTASINLTLDTTPPDAVIEAVLTDDVLPDADGLVADATPTLTGSAEAGATVELYDASGSLLGQTVASDGTWSIETPLLADGTHDLHVVVTDVAGNSTTSSDFTVTIDSSVAVATLDGISDDTGTSGDNITSDSSPSLYGTAEVGATVVVYPVVGGAPDLAAGVTASVAADGSWTFAPGTLTDGTYTYRAKVTDAAGNTAWTTDLTLVVDTTVQAAVLTEVRVDDGGSPDSLAISSGSTTTDTSPLLIGSAERNARVDIYVDGVLAAQTFADDGGLWSANLSGLSAASHDITLQTVDVAGNVAGDPAGPTEFTLLVEAPPQPEFDPLYGEQWNLTMLGGLEDVWQDYTGFGVTVAIYDDGIAYDHVDLDDNYDASLHLTWSGSELDPLPSNADEGVHGTAVAGVIAGERNGQGTIGIAYDATIVGVNIFSGPANINDADTSGFEYAIAQMGNFDVVNHSWGGAPVYLNDTSPAILTFVQAAEDATTFGREGLGTIILKAAGNWADSSQGDFADTTRYTITVGAYDSDGDVSWYSSRGANILVSAPSSGNTIVDADGNLTADSNLRIPTTDRDGDFGYGPDSWSSAFDTSGFGGTSAATPTVSGVVALMLEANPDLGWRDVQNILAQSAIWTGSEVGVQNHDAELVPVDLDTDGVRETTGFDQIEYFAGVWNGADTWNGGGMHFSEDYGYGAVSALAAVRMSEVWSMFGDAQTSANEASYGTGVMAPDLSVSGDGDIASWSFDYSGPAMDLEYVDIYVNLSTALMQEVMLQITSPDGTTTTLLDLPINDYTPAYDFLGLTLLTVNVTWTFGANAFRGEDPNGTWTVTLQEKDATFDVDNYGTEFDGNSIVELGMDFHGLATGLENDVYTYTDEMLSMGLNTDPSRVSLTDTGGVDWLNLAAMTVDASVDLTSGVTADTGNGFVQIASFEAGTVIENAVTGDGNDVLVGNGADNRLAGMRGDDEISGGNGSDELYGHFGNDIVSGGSGADMFYFEAGHGDDVILDFDQSEFDVVSLSGFSETSFADLSFSLSGSDQVLSFSTGDSLTFSNGSELLLTASDFLFESQFVA